MNLRPACLAITSLAGGALVAGLGILFLGTPDQVARVPASALLVAGLLTIGGTIYLAATKPRSRTAPKPQSLASTLGFAVLTVLALFLIGFFLTHH